jgi:hypothetical protein
MDLENLRDASIPITDHEQRNWLSRSLYLHTEMRRRLFETHLSPSDGLGLPRCQPLGVVEWLGRVVDWCAVSELKLGNPNRTPRMDQEPLNSFSVRGENGE